MSDLSVLILCGRSPRHLAVANRLCQAGKPIAIVHETGTQWSLKKVLKLLRPDNFFNKAWRWLRDRRRYAGNKEATFFFGNRQPTLDFPHLVVEVPHINHPAVVRLADQTQPDVIAVFGTSLIRGPLLTKGKFGIVNLHGGLSPHYRGADCTFWALHNGEPDQVGCTLHFINEGIDTGDLIAHVCPEIKEDDDELTLFWRAVRLSANAYADLLARFENGERFGVAQQSNGTLYQVKDRSFQAERQLESLLDEGLLKKYALPQRLRWFHRSQAHTSPTETAQKT